LLVLYHCSEEEKKVIVFSSLRSTVTLSGEERNAILVPRKRVPDLYLACCKTSFWPSIDFNCQSEIEECVRKFFIELAEQIGKGPDFEF
jgi:hypothetical protein